MLIFAGGNDARPKLESLPIIIAIAFYDKSTIRAASSLRSSFVFVAFSKGVVSLVLHDPCNAWDEVEQVSVTDSHAGQRFSEAAELWCRSLTPRMVNVDRGYGVHGRRFSNHLNLVRELHPAGSPQPRRFSKMLEMYIQGFLGIFEVFTTLLGDTRRSPR